MIKRALQNRTVNSLNDWKTNDDAAYYARRAIGAFLRQARSAKGLTQEDVAAAIHIRNTAVSAIEIGRNSVPPERYEEFAQVLGLDKTEWGLFLLEYTDPWLYALLGGEKHVRERLSQIPERVHDTRKSRG